MKEGTHTGASEVLRKARKLLEKPEALIYDDLAVDKHGRRVNHCEAIAVAWCPVGAIYRAAHDVYRRANGLSLDKILDDYDRQMEELKLGDDSCSVIERVTGVEMYRWEHPRGHLPPSHAEVLAVLDKAIEAAGEVL